MPLTMDTKQVQQLAEAEAASDESKPDILATVFIGMGSAGLLLIIGFWTLFFNVNYVAIVALGLAAIVAIRAIYLAIGETRRQTAAQ